MKIIVITEAGKSYHQNFYQNWKQFKSLEEKKCILADGTYEQYQYFSLDIVSFLSDFQNVSFLNNSRQSSEGMM